MNVRKKRAVAALVGAGSAAVFLSGCAGEEAPLPESDSGRSFSADSARIPVDENVYKIKGKVIGGVESHSRTEAGGSTSGSMINGYGSMSGSYWLEQTGKGFVRLDIQSMSPANPKLGGVNDVVVLKTTDQKALALQNGDVVEWTCRADYENVGAVLENERFDKDDINRLGTWELDLCRMTSPNIGDAPVKTPGSGSK